jgi:TonB-linked SusC/RagA family outer membrane protein
MMKLKSCVCFILLGLLTFFSFEINAQEKSKFVSIVGVVKDQDGGKLLSGVSIANEKGTVLSLTDEKGAFDLKVIEGSVLVFSYVSYETQQLTAKSSTAVEILMVSKGKELEAVVVTTALGITKKQKSLGYSLQQLGSEDVLDARSNNWSSALSGKVAGLNLLSAGSGPMNTTRISLRGDASMNPDGNYALVVVDGVPINNSMATAGVNNAYGAGSGNDIPVDFGNAVSDLNPDDIESISVLKGPGATALYGSRAANGALLITTKSGARKEKGLGISYSSNISLQNVLNWPDYQYEYGQGTGKSRNAAGEFFYSYGATADGASTSGTSSAFGPKFNGQNYFQYDPNVQGVGATKTPWVPYKNNISDFWRTGSTITNSISLDGSTDRSSGRIALTHSKNEWIMPNTGFERVTASTSFSSKISDKIKISGKANYINKKSDNVPGTGYNNQSIAYFMIFQNPNVDLNWYRDIWRKDLYQVDQIHPFSSFIDNPFLIAHEMTNSVNSNSFFGNITANISIAKNLDLLLRSALTTASEKREMQRPFSSANFLRGYYKEQRLTDLEMNSDFLFSYKNKFGKDIELSASAGGNTRNNDNTRADAYVDGLVIPGVYKLANGLGQSIITTYDRKKVVNSFYGTGSIGFKNAYFLDFSGRNDWSSTLALKNNSFFYPSVNAAVVLSDVLKLPSAISFAKLRISAAQAGNDTEPYKNRRYYTATEFAGSAVVPTILPNYNLKPEISTSYELGLDLRLLKSRLNFDLTVYENRTKNQILDVPLDPTTGYTRAVLNSGLVRNRGVEVIVNAKPVRSKNFKWDVSINWALNRNKVLELAEGMDGKQDIGYGGNATLQARVGGTTGDIYGFGFVRSPEGKIVYTSTGLPARPADIQYIGNAYADWKGGLKNEFTYKEIKFSILLDGQLGGKIYSQTHHKMTEQGKLVHTLKGREENFIIGDGVVLNAATGKYDVNTIKVLPVDYYADYYRRANVESNTFDASFLKVREMRLEKSIPQRVLGKSFIKQASFAIYGRDLLMISNFPMFDPETASLNGSTLLPGVEMGQMPSTRTIGLNLTFKF